MVLRAQSGFSCWLKIAEECGGTKGFINVRIAIFIQQHSSSHYKHFRRKSSMSVTTIGIALLWGAISGLLVIHLLANLLAVLFCLHGVILTRWKRLANKAAPGVVKYDINLNLLVRASCFALLFAVLLSLGDELVRKQFQFRYSGNILYLFSAAAIVSAAVRCNSTFKKLQIIWRMSHNFDYAERRQRTKRLKN